MDEQKSAEVISLRGATTDEKKTEGKYQTY
jgi:hypothetical protein